MGKSRERYTMLVREESKWAITWYKMRTSGWGAVVTRMSDMKSKLVILNSKLTDCKWIDRTTEMHPEDWFYVMTKDEVPPSARAFLYGQLALLGRKGSVTDGVQLTLGSLTATES